MATTAGRLYLTVDALGSTRLVTNTDGTAVVESEDYLPFGEQLAAGTNGRVAAPLTTGGIVPEKKFTGKGAGCGIRVRLFWSQILQFSPRAVHQPGPQAVLFAYDCESAEVEQIRIHAEQPPCTG